VSANFYLVNGWDNTDDNNKGKTFGLTVGLTPIEQIGLIFNLMYGPEKDSTNSDNRFLFDWVGTFKPLKNTTVVLNTDYATEQHSAAGGGTAKWYGIAGYVKYDFSELVSGTVRAEYFNDKDGLRTGAEQKIKEITVTPEFRVAKAIVVRPEYRHDWSDKKSFDSGTKKNQDTIALGVMYTW
jgi:maltoporin